MTVKNIDSVSIDILRSLVLRDIDKSSVKTMDRASVVEKLVEDLSKFDNKELESLQSDISKRVGSQEFDFTKPFIYLAGPFFNFQERITIILLEIALESSGYRVYSPSRDGSKLDITTDSKSIRKAVFDDNILGVRHSSAVVAVIDNRDSGTMFELGAKYVFDKLENSLIDFRSRILTYSAHNYGVNLMLLESIQKHHTTIDTLLDSVSKVMNGDSVLNLDELMDIEVI